MTPGSRLSSRSGATAAPGHRGGSRHVATTTTRTPQLAKRLTRCTANASMAPRLLAFARELPVHTTCSSSLRQARDASSRSRTAPLATAVIAVQFRESRPPRHGHSYRDFVATQMRQSGGDMKATVAKWRDEGRPHCSCEPLTDTLKRLHADVDCATRNFLLLLVFKIMAIAILLPTPVGQGSLAFMFCV